ncbi:Peptidase C14 caspase domain-containing protein OS=Streptomyces aurantiogriseus OX=66870 GN=GCM10010251_58410 PE=4 SV=1 [Streptomyces aurantiogriseus]
MEYAFEGPELAENCAPRPSVFTHAVVQGLETGEADLDADGEVSLDDLYDYVFDHVREQNPNQTPSRTVEMQGDLHLAHSRRGRIKIVKVPSPPSLTAAVHSDNAFTRQGAVVELRARLHDESVDIAEGARQDLEEVARNDIRQIADQACRALREIRPTPSPDHLDFGLLPQGSTPQQQSVTLSGPPLARHCLAQSTQSWLRVEPSENGVNVRVETHAEGHLSGDIVLKGVADDAVVHVEAVVAPAREPEPEVREPVAPEPVPPESHVPAPERPEPHVPAPERPEPHVPAPERPESHVPEPGVTEPVVPEPPAQPPPRTEPDTVLVRPAPSPTPPAVPPRIIEEPAARRTPRRRAAATAATGSLRAPALATAALALAVTAVVMVVITAQLAVEAVDGRLDSPGTELRHHAQAAGVIAPLATALLTAAAALVPAALARHELSARPGRCTPAAKSATETLISVTKGLAIPALVLATLAAVAYLVTRGF